MHKEIMEFLRYWVGIRGSSELPQRDQVDPLTIPRHLLSKVYLMTFDEVRDDIRFTLAGPLRDTVEVAEITGTHVSALPNRIAGSREAYAEHIRGLYRSARWSRRPVHSRGTYRWNDWQPEVVTERLTCPVLARDGRTVEFSGVQVYERATLPGIGLIDTADDYVPEFVRVIDDPEALLA